MESINLESQLLGNILRGHFRIWKGQASDLSIKTFGTVPSEFSQDYSSTFQLSHISHLDRYEIPL